MKRIHIFDHEAYHKTLKHQIGSGLPVFAGYRQQGGGLGSIVGLIGRYVLPLFAKHVIPHAKSAVFNTLSDVAKGKTIGDALHANSTSLLKNVGDSLLDRQTGRGLETLNTVDSENISSVTDEPFPMACRKRRNQVKPKNHPVKKRKSASKKTQKKNRTIKSISKKDIFSKAKWH